MTTTTSPPAFQFPPLHTFPPFYTLQPNSTTLRSQLQTWSSIIQAYCRSERVFSLSLLDALSTPLFHNRSINRKLQLRDARKVVDFMCSKEGGQRAEWIGDAAGSRGKSMDNEVWKGLVREGLVSGGSGGSRDVDDGGAGGGAGEGGAESGSEDRGGSFWVYWRRPEEWAEVVEGWVDGTGQKGTVLTVYEILESEATSSQEFHGMDPELMQRVLGVLVKRGKAQVFGEADSLGVKFF